jgi:hypothetical protein
MPDGRGRWPLIFGRSIYATPHMERNKWPNNLIQPKTKSISSHEPGEVPDILFFIRTVKNGPVAPLVSRFRPDLGLHPSGDPRPSPVFRDTLGDSGRKKYA